MYTNTIRAYSSSYGEITRQSHFKMNVGCQMEQDSVSQIMYIVEHNGNSSITGSGRFNTSMAFYTSSNFYYKVCLGNKEVTLGPFNTQIFRCNADIFLCQVTQVPYVVTLNQNLYVQVDLRRGDNTLVLFIDTCVASPSPHDFQTRPYYLVRNG